jgi:hypothetical protein
MICDSTNFTEPDAATRRERTKASADRLLSLAAAPTFAIMALLTGVHRGNAPDMLCSATQGALPLTGMVPMYLLMSAFHLRPWLKLVCSRQRGARPFSDLFIRAAQPWRHQ